MNAPEQCPVCGAAGHKSKAQPISHFDCGAYWYWSKHDPLCAEIGPWWKPCPHAMTAAVRCGATLEPTPLELARQALVDASVNRRKAMDAYVEAASDANVDNYDRAVDAWNTAVTAYSALLEPKP